MGQPPDVLHRHDEVAGRLEQLHGLVMGDAEEAPPVHLQDLVSNLRSQDVVRLPRPGGFPARDAASDPTREELLCPSHLKQGTQQLGGSVREMGQVPVAGDQAVELTSEGPVKPGGACQGSQARPVRPASPTNCIYRPVWCNSPQRTSCPPAPTPPVNVGCQGPSVEAPNPDLSVLEGGFNSSVPPQSPRGPVGAERAGFHLSSSPVSFPAPPKSSHVAVGASLTGWPYSGHSTHRAPHVLLPFVSKALSASPPRSHSTIQPAPDSHLFETALS